MLNIGIYAYVYCCENALTFLKYGVKARLVSSEVGLIRGRLSAIGVAPRDFTHGWLSSATGHRYRYCPYVVSSSNPAALLTLR